MLFSMPRLKVALLIGVWHMSCFGNQAVRKGGHTCRARLAPRRCKAGKADSDEATCVADQGQVVAEP